MTVSRRVAFCGVLSSLAMIILFATFFPYGTVALTALAGLMLVPSSLELGSRFGWACYGVTALLTLLLVPSIPAKVMYILFFGFYPLVQLRVNLWHSRAAQWIVKAILLNAALALAMVLWLTVLAGDAVRGIDRWILIAAVPLANVLFMVYDAVLWQIVGMYRVRLHPFISKWLR